MAIGAGLPNIWGSTNGNTTWSNLGSVGIIGAIEVFCNSPSSEGWSTGTGRSHGGGNFRFNASWSNGIYGSSETVTPSSLGVQFCIKF